MEVILDASGATLTELPPLLFEPESADLQSDSTLKDLKGYTEESIIVHPNAWMNSFGIVAPDEVRAINRRISSVVFSEQGALSLTITHKSK